MSGHAYVDTSALVKLVIRESESEALRTEIDRRSGLIASRLVLLEARRVILRRPDHRLMSTLAAVLDVVVMVDITRAILEQAADVAPPALRSLDAIHVATALSAGDPAIAVITYDQRLADAARANGLTVVQPGREP